MHSTSSGSTFADISINGDGEANRLADVDEDGAGGVRSTSSGSTFADISINGDGEVSPLADVHEDGDGSGIKMLRCRRIFWCLRDVALSG